MEVLLFTEQISFIYVLGPRFLIAMITQSDIMYCISVDKIYIPACLNLHCMHNTVVTQKEINTVKCPHLSCTVSSWWKIYHFSIFAVHWECNFCVIIILIFLKLQCCHTVKEFCEMATDLWEIRENSCSETTAVMLTVNKGDRWCLKTTKRNKHHKNLKKASC